MSLTQTPNSPISVGKKRVEIRGEVPQACRNLFTPEAVDFLVALHDAFQARRLELLRLRVQRQTELDRGVLPSFRPETEAIRNSHFRVAPIPKDLQDRRVEITGPVDRKMVINALNSGANCYMADFEDSHSPTWEGTLEGQINLRDAIDGTIEYVAPETGKHYRLNPQVATLLVRPRGWHLVESHFHIDGESISGSLFDFGLFFFHNAQKLLDKGSGPYFYLPKLESYLEARLWNDVFVLAQSLVGIPAGSIRATVLIETIMAAFQMDEILYELRDHMSGLNCGRWDYIFSYIKRFRRHHDRILPDRGQVTMTTHFLRSYSLLVIKTCHKRQAHAMGGMAAQIPIRDDASANQVALDKVRADKHREANDGHDGTWVAHPGLVAIAREEFDRVMTTPNQIHRLRDDVQIHEHDLLQVPRGTITEEGMRLNIRVGMQYMEAWLCGNGCVPLYNLMEDAATAEISRTQLWQWLHHRAQLDDGRLVTLELFHRLCDEELERVRKEVGEERFEKGRFPLAMQLLKEIVESPELEEFLTLKAYPHLDTLPSEEKNHV